MRVQHFNKTEISTRMCCCSVRPSRYTHGQWIGVDAFDFEYRAVIDDFGNIVFVGEPL